MDDRKQQVLDQLLDIVRSLEGDYDPLWGSMVKQALRRVNPGFTEAHYGYGSFSAMLQDAESRGLLEIDYDKARGNHKVRAKG